MPRDEREREPRGLGPEREVVADENSRAERPLPARPREEGQRGPDGDAKRRELLP